MSSENEIQPEVWDKAIEHIGDLPGVSADGRDPSHLVNVSRLISTVPRHKALERVGMPASVYDEKGNRILGPEEFPIQLSGTMGNSTWNSVGPRGELLIFHPVVLESKAHTLCMGLDAGQLQSMLPDTSQLTQAEFGVLAGVMTGQTVRGIAEADRVSYNTRRRQIETVLEKLGVHSQVGAVRLIYVTVVDRLLQALSSVEADPPTINKLAQYYGDEVRFHLIHLSGSPPIRVAEYGDYSGQPVLLAHSMFFPCGPAPSAIADIRKAGFRVICPFRPGFFDAPEWHGKLDSKAILAAWAERCNTLLNFLNLGKVHVASHSFSAVWAAEFARRYSDRTKSLILCSAPQPSNLWNSEARTTTFIHSVAGIVEKAPWLATPIIRLHAARVHDFDSTLKAFLKTYKHGPEDMS